MLENILAVLLSKPFIAININNDVMPNSAGSTCSAGT